MDGRIDYDSDLIGNIYNTFVVKLKIVWNHFLLVFLKKRCSCTAFIGSIYSYKHYIQLINCSFSYVTFNESYGNPHKPFSCSMISRSNVIRTRVRTSLYVWYTHLYGEPFCKHIQTHSTNSESEQWVILKHNVCCHSLTQGHWWK